jgi:arylsulfatase A-like enzyme
MKALVKLFIFCITILVNGYAQTQAVPKKMNVIYILADDHRYDAMGFMNKIQGLQTPGLDRMAREGVHIKNAFVTTALCSPSRASSRASMRIQGQSFLPLLQGKTIPWRKNVFYEYYWEAAFPSTPTIFSIRTERYKYIYNHGVWDINELYDIQQDPYEMNNLIRNKTFMENGKKLRDELFNWLESTNSLQLPLKKAEGSRFDHKYRDTY